VERALRRFLARYWGFLALIVAIVGAIEHLATVAVLVLAALAFLYMLVQAPLVCGAPGRQGPCRNNSHGILLGCWIRQHKWQRAKRLFISQRWSDLTKSLLGSAKDALATISALIAIGTFAATAIGHL
jgi:predicted RND superfamily exporter protein